MSLRVAREKLAMCDLWRVVQCANPCAVLWSQMDSEHSDDLRCILWRFALHLATSLRQAPKGRIASNQRTSSPKLAKPQLEMVRINPVRSWLAYTLRPRWSLPLQRLTFNTGEYESPHKVDRRRSHSELMLDGVQLFDGSLPRGPRLIRVVNKCQQMSTNVNNTAVHLDSKPNKIWLIAALLSLTSDNILMSESHESVSHCPIPEHPTILLLNSRPWLYDIQVCQYPTSTRLVGQQLHVIPIFLHHTGISLNSSTLNYWFPMVFPFKLTKFWWFWGTRRGTPIHCLSGQVAKLRDVSDEQLDAALSVGTDVLWLQGCWQLGRAAQQPQMHRSIMVGLQHLLELRQVWTADWHIAHGKITPSGFNIHLWEAASKYPSLSFVFVSPAASTPEFLTFFGNLQHRSTGYYPLVN